MAYDKDHKDFAAHVELIKTQEPLFNDAEAVALREGHDAYLARNESADLMAYLFG